MANNPIAGLNAAQMATFLAAAAGGVPLANVPGQQAQVVAPEQANALAQVLQTLQNQQIPAQPAPWPGLAQFLQPQPAPQPIPQPQQEPAKATHEEIEYEYREARSAQLDKTLVLFLRAAQSSNMTRYAILEDMNGRHGHSAEWWRTYYLIFADDIDRLVQGGIKGANSDDLSSNTRTKPLPGASTLKPVRFPSMPEPSSSSARKRKERPASPLPSEESDTVEIVDAPVSHNPTGSARKAARRDTASAKAPDPHYKLTIPSSLPENAPSVPTNLVACGRGHIFTDEDIAYFVATVLWQAKTTPNPSKQTILVALSTQATHHSFGSWDTFWGRVKGQDVLREGLRMAAAAAATSVAKQE